MKTLTMRTCPTCRNILTFMNIATCGYSICWNCRHKVLLNVTFTQEMIKDDVEFNHVQLVWRKRANMLKDFTLSFDLVENFEEISVEEVKRFLEDSKSKVMWQTAYRRNQ